MGNNVEGGEKPREKEKEKEGEKSKVEEEVREKLEKLGMLSDEEVARMIAEPLECDPMRLVLREYTDERRFSWVKWAKKDWFESQLEVPSTWEQSAPCEYVKGPDTTFPGTPVKSVMFGTLITGE